MSLINKVEAYLKDKNEDFEYAVESFRDDVWSTGLGYAIFSRLKILYNRTIGSLIRKISRIVWWIPVLWKDEDWDHRYILTILDKKLERTRDAIKNGHGDDEQWINPRCAEIDEARDLLSIVLKDEFVESEFNSFYEKYGHIKMIDREVDPKTGCIRCDMVYEKTIMPDGTINKEILEEAHEEIRRLSAIEEERRGEAYQKLFSSISKNIRNWWD